MGHGNNDHSSSGHSSYKGYAIGFILSVILTAIPFGIVMHPMFSAGTTIAIFLIFAIVQVIVHLHYFLHMDLSPESRDTVVSFVFTAIIIVLVIGGSMWIMENLNHNTMIMGN